MNPLNHLTQSSNRKAWITAGLVLAGLALRARGPFRALLLLASGAMLVNSVRPARNALTQAPSDFGEGERDKVDEASWESFPASDPPSYSTLGV